MIFPFEQVISGSMLIFPGCICQEQLRKNGGGETQLVLGEVRHCWRLQAKSWWEFVLAWGRLAHTRSCLEIS